MAGYLSESDFVMVEEGFSTRDLLEELTLGASQATTGKVAAFFVADAVVRKHFCFLKYLPRVRPFYAVRCNSSLGVLKVLAELGLGFSCASKAEMELVQHIGVPASKIICANPCKQVAQIKYAAKHGVRLLSFDNEVELAKVVKSHPSAKSWGEVLTLDALGLHHTHRRVGCSLMFQASVIASVAQGYLELVCQPFHIGSGCPDPQAYAQSIADARLVFQMGAELGHTMNILDLGGGFPGLEGAKVRFEEVTSVIGKNIPFYTPPPCHVPLRTHATKKMTSSDFCCRVHVTAKEKPLFSPFLTEQTGAAPKSIVYHLDEGVYGVFNSVLFDNTCPTPALQKKPSADQPLYSSSLWGPAVDGCDCVAEGLWLPQLQVGDWLVFDNMGAYTVDTKSLLGGTQACRVTYAMSRLAWEALQGQLLPAEEDQDAEGVCKPLSCGWEITDSLCVGPVFTPASIM
uniref:Antizyme inhibitor 2 n=1 Tax=Rattus norvegicus TaxID=10116 RepID=AZIN2_RAT|nr:RecName: Full=Antizyme inhibitor 2; Short=AzI2; AltName: Full=Ornithine decarboxylase-like protein; Short=ODC-like protein; AltName: Full=ornithine decarboxylase paralog; Short=ODC-p [Rattus norvegicus]